MMTRTLLAATLAMAPFAAGCADMGEEDDITSAEANFGNDDVGNEPDGPMTVSVNGGANQGEVIDDVGDDVSTPPTGECDSSLPVDESGLPVDCSTPPADDDEDDGDVDDPDDVDTDDPTGGGDDPGTGGGDDWNPDGGPMGPMLPDDQPWKIRVNEDDV